MASDADPYRILGLARGATLAEVKRAYRRLAKANHPDAVGGGALPRFLAIQSAYDQLAGPDGSGDGIDGPVRGTGAARPAAPPAGGGPARGSARTSGPDGAGATHRAYGGRTRRARPGARPAPGPGPGPRPGGGSAAGDAPGTGAAGAARPPNRATPGSTSYDGTDAEPFEPDWGGASWYGTTSGTYWTLNPKEYADPRKHGPEYQARARRGKGSGVGNVPDGFDQDAPEPVGNAPGSDVPPSRDAGDEPPATHTTASWWQATAGPSARRPTGDPRPDPERSTGRAPDRAPDRARGQTSGPGDQRGSPARSEPMRDSRRWPGPGSRPETGGRASVSALAWLDDGGPGPVGRVVRALVGWASLALGIAWLAGEISGCARFAASCDAGTAPMTWIVLVVVLAALLLAPRLATIGAMATLATLAAAVPGALLLSATGGSQDAIFGREILGGVLVVAWVVGLGTGVWRATRPSAERGRPVS